MNWYAYAATAATWTLIGYVAGCWRSAIKERDRLHTLSDRLSRVRGER